MSTAVGIMRRVLIDVARSKKTAKRTPPAEPWRLSVDAEESQKVDLLDLDEALLRLANLDSRKTDLVELRYFGGMTNEEVAHTLGISVATIKREWALSKAWLYQELKDETAS
jgi:RNA polymerase sigma factor (TIGR02999 family)